MSEIRFALVVGGGIVVNRPTSDPLRAPVHPDHAPPTERDLVAAARAGSDAAWIELRARHEPAVAAVAGRGRAAASATAEAMQRLRTRLDDVDDDDAVGAIRAVRPLAIASLTGGAYGPTPPNDAAASGAGIVEPIDLQIAEAFARLPGRWQTVLWHRWVERVPAATLATTLGRSPNEVVSLEAVAAAGLFDRYLSVVLEGLVDESSRPFVAQLGGYARGALPTSEQRAIEAHLAADDDIGKECARHLGVVADLPERTPAAITPGVTGVGLVASRSLLGAAVAVGAAAMAAERAERRVQRARLVAVVGVIVALVGAAVLIRSPFGDLDSEIADLLERAGDVTTTTSPSSSGGDEPGPAAVASRIELVFPGALQGITYVPGPDPLALSAALSMPAPAYAGGTVTIDAAVTNAADGDPDVRFVVRVSAGVEFDVLADGSGACDPAAGGGAACRVQIEPGTTASMSLRFSLERVMPDRLVVAPNIPSDVLDVPIEEVDDLALALVERGRLVLGGATFDDCVDDCAASASVDVDWPEGAVVEHAVVVWAPVSLAAIDGARLATPAGDTVDVPVSDTDEPTAPIVVDVSDVVGEAGPGRYSFDRGDSSTPGSWSLGVVVSEPGAPRRLLVVVQPAVSVRPDQPFSVVVPVASPTAPPPSGRRPLQLSLMIGEAPDAVVRVGTAELDDDGRSDRDTGARTYDLDIGPDDDDLRIDAATTARPYELTGLSFALDIVT